MEPLVLFVNAIVLVILGVRNLRGYKRRTGAGPDLPSLHLSRSTAPSPSFDINRLLLPDEPLDRERNSSLFYGTAFLTLAALMASVGIYVSFHR